jgi:hypothetical protein
MTAPAETEVETDGEEQLDQDDVWSDRAQQMVDFVKAQKPPVAKLQTIIVFARRKGWEHPTLIGVLEYCEKKKLLAGYRSINSPAWKIPLTPVFDATDGEPAAKADAAPDGCLCARTAPEPNFGCPVHGGARLKKTIVKETTNMAKEWITTAEAAELLGVSMNRVCVRIKEKALDAKEDDSHVAGGRKPFLIRRASVIAFLEKKKHADILDEKPAKAEKPKQAKAPPQQERVVAVKKARAPKNIVAKLADEIGSLREDIIMLVRLVERGWMSQDEAFAKLRGIAETL